MESKNMCYFLALNAMPLLGPRSAMKLIKRWPLLESAFTASNSALLDAGINQSQINQIKNFNWDTIKNDLKYTNQEENQTILTWDSPDYPPLLKEIYAPPIVLYAKGNLSCLKQKSIAIVGSRYPSYHGNRIAFAWSKSLSLFDLTIVSGLAKGIDTAAHNGTLEGSGKTIAVLGTGIDLVYPSSNTLLARKITQNGLFLSEFPLKTPPKAGHFPQRNRIISGLTVATLVVEATLKSGSLITARFALEQNRDVLALPGSISLPQSRGCHHLLKQGASLVTCYQDVLLELGFAPDKTNERSRLGLGPTNDLEDERSCNKAENSRAKNIYSQQLDFQRGANCESPGVYIGVNEEASTICNKAENSRAKSILDCIGVEPISIDTIATNNNLSKNETICLLTKLELDGKICAVPGGYIRLGGFS